MSTHAIDPVLARQLKRLKLDAEQGPQTPAEWASFLAAVNDHYLRMNDDRSLVNRSLELSTSEMDRLRQRVEMQRDRLSHVIGAISEALGHFGALMQGDSNTAQVSAAKGAFANRLQSIFDKSEIFEDHSADVSLVRGNLVRLADSLITMLSDAAERAGMRKELEVARIVQQLLVPSEDVIDRPQVRIVGLFQPASECGGDWWTVTDLADQRVLSVIGDVTGHGVSSAIITGAAKAACDLAVHMTQGRLGASELLGLMNATLFQTGKRQIMMTCLAAVFDPAARMLSLANAGHPFPLLVRQGIVHPLMAEGAPLGAAPDSQYAAIQVAVEPGDLLVSFTDGVVECENPLGEQFSERRLRAVAQRAAPGGALKVRDAVVDALIAFRQDTPMNDDLTLIATSVR